MKPGPLLDHLVLAPADPAPGEGRAARACFVPTASGDDEGYVARFHEAFADRAETTSVELFRRSARPADWDLRTHVLAQDVIYVGGGSTANLLALAAARPRRDPRRSPVDGVVLAGISAG